MQGWVRSPEIISYACFRLPRGPEQVPAGNRSRLLATFNSGFYEKDAAAGFYTNGLLYHPMIRGLARSSPTATAASM